MKINLHHAQMYCLHAVSSLSSAAWAAGLYKGGGELERDYLKSAREQLARALEELTAYETQLLTSEAA